MASIADRCDFLELLESRLTDSEAAVISTARAWSEQRELPLYLVGGSVRDLLLGRRFLDLDLALDAGVSALAQLLGETFAARVVVHPRFETASVTGSDWSVDVTRTRREEYAYPGALPAVSPAPMREDLARRDFTVHAMAIALTGPAAGELIDPYAGKADLNARLLRVLHDESFRDDPTRIMRLARYSARLTFAVEQHTKALTQRDVAFLANMSPARLTHELERIFAEERPEYALLALDHLRALRCIYASFHLPANVANRFERLRDDGAPLPGMAEYLSAIVAGWQRADIEALADRLDPTRDVEMALRDVPKALAALRRLPHLTNDGAGAAEVVRVLSPLSLAAVRGAAAAESGVAAKLAQRFIGELRNTRSILRGDDVLELGVPAGPAVGQVLSMLKQRRLAGDLHTAGDERGAVLSWLAACDNEDRRG